MKVVTNSKGFGLKLNDVELKMFCALRGYTLPNHTKPMSSDTTWFNEVHWVQFRTDPLLVRLVECGMASNEALKVVSFEDDYLDWWDIDTDYRSSETVVAHYWCVDETNFEEHGDDWALEEIRITN
jgi:hypothetical protein